MTGLLAALEPFPPLGFPETGPFGSPALGLVLLGLAGILAGILNSIAGGGSFLTLPLAMGLGLPPGVANGSLRIAVVAQNAVGVLSFHRREIREYRVAFLLLAPMAVGAAGGAWLATHLDDAILRPIFGAVLVLWAVVLLVKPGNFEEPPEDPNPITLMTHVWALLIGIYGGFIQAGVGFPLLALLVMHLGYDPVKANMVKVLLVGCYTLVALPFFIMAGQVAWIHGSVLAAGMMLGAYLGVHLQTERGASLVRWFVLVTVTVSGLGMIIKTILGA